MAPLPEEEESPPTTTMAVDDDNDNNNNNNNNKKNQNKNQNNSEIPVRASRFRSSTQAGRPAWPEEEEERTNTVRVRSCYSCGGCNWKLELQKWTYSYMGTLLQKTSPPPPPPQSVKPRRDTLDDDTVATTTNGPPPPPLPLRRLQMKDLYRIPRSMKSSLLVSKFEKHYNQASSSSTSSTSSSHGRLLDTLWQLAKPTFIPGGYCQLIAVTCQIIMPLLVRQLLQVLEDHPGQKVIFQGQGGGLMYAIGIFLTLVVNALATHRHRHLALKTGIVLRSSLVAVLYGRLLQLTAAGRRGLSLGEVSTLVAIDAQKLFEVTQEAHLIWSLPLSMTLVMICLLAIMGPTTLVGLVVLFLFIPIFERIARTIQSVRQQRVKCTDQRVDIVNAMLQGIKVTKLNHYEDKYQHRIETIRQEEHALLRIELAFWGMSLLSTVISPMLASASTFATFVLIKEDNDHVLTAAQTFTVLLLFIALRFPISLYGRLIGRVAQAKGAIQRLEEFMNRPIRDDDGNDNKEQQELKEDNNKDKGNTTNTPTKTTSTHDDTTDTVLKVKNASFRVGRGEGELDKSTMAQSSHHSSSAIGFEVSGITFSIQRGQVLALVGPVASGKSTIINGLIEEVPSLPGTEIIMTGRVSHVSQTAFILNATLRENILFGLELDQEWYDKVLDACCLRPDLEQLGEAGDLTEIGERGVTLSGGQKQRVSLARAAYARPDVILMDDPLSALDANTAKQVFDRLIKSRSSSILSNAAIVLVTHASHFLNRVDLIMIVVDGKSQFTGTWEELSDFQPQNPKAKAAIDYIRSSVQEGSAEEECHSRWSMDAVSGDVDHNTTKKDGKLMTVEEREHGISSIRTWLLWFQHAGGLPFIVTMGFLMAFDRFVYFGSEYWLARWTQGAYEPVTVFGVEFPAQIDGRSAQFEYLKVYATIMCAAVFFTFLRSEWAVLGGARCAKNVFLAMLHSVLLAPVSYFETTPLGRILNRFTYDVEVIDVTLTESMSILMIAAGWFTTGVVVMVSIVPYVAFALLPVTTIYWLLLLKYRRCGTDLQRLDAVARSPIHALVSEGLEGCTTIRIYRQVGTFVNVFHDVVDESSSALVNFVSAQRWLGLRIEVLGSSIVLCNCLLVICLNDVLGLEPGIMALLIIWASNFTVTLGRVVDAFADGEAAITSMERVHAMVSIVHEKPMTNTASNELSPSWPHQGLLEFHDVCLRYREGLPLALNKLSFTIPPGARCGVVGRTGAGKSSLTVALFRLVEIESGRIMLDGVNLGSLGLADVRGRANGMTIIPQDPFIAGTTLREVLDPFQQAASDEEILEALVAVRLADSNSTLSVLDDPMSEGGSNFSVGERQLLNLARALLFQSKLLILDEATASIDGETDVFIQKMLRTRFPGTTLVTVAHRLNTIMDYDIILVMDGGRAVEFGSPTELLETNGIFAELVQATGPESARALREIAMAASASSVSSTAIVSA